MPHLISPDGRDIGEVTDPRYLDYYLGSGYTAAPAAKPAVKQADEPPEEHAPRKATHPHATSAKHEPSTTQDEENKK